MFLKLVMHRILFCGFLFSFVLIGTMLHGAEPMDVSPPADSSVKAMVKLIGLSIKQRETQSVIYWLDKATCECPGALTFSTSNGTTLMMILVEKRHFNAISHLCGLLVSRFPDRIKNVISARTKRNNTIFHVLAKYGTLDLFCYFINFLKVSTLFSAYEKYELLSQSNQTGYTAGLFLDHRFSASVLERDEIMKMNLLYIELLGELSVQYYLRDSEPVSAFGDSDMDVEGMEMPIKIEVSVFPEGHVG